MSELIITNGDVAADLLAAAGLSGRMLAWRDVLHEGPLADTVSLDALSDIRATYLGRRFDLPYAEVRADFLARDAVIGAHGLFDHIAIWLEHDLYDQLQLLQIVHFLHREGRTEGVTLVQADDFLGNQTPETVLRFADRAVPLTRVMADTAAAFWQSLLQPSPDGLVRQLRATTAGFPHLRQALGRMLEELPSSRSGLTHTERTLLLAIAEGGANARTAFVRLLAAEEAAFMGDLSTFRVLDDLAFAPRPLVSGLDTVYPCRGDAGAAEDYLARPLSLTRFGQAVLAGQADMVAENGIDRWWAGTRLTGHDVWRWDSPGRRLVPPAGPARRPI